MEKTATEVMQEILFCSLVQNIDALRKASKGLPNTLARDIASIHSNASLADLPPEVQHSIKESTTAAFKRLRGEGYTVTQQDVLNGASRPNAFPKTSQSRRRGQS